MNTQSKTIVNPAIKTKVEYELRPYLFGLFKFWEEVKATEMEKRLYIETDENPRVFVNGEEYEKVLL